MTDDPTTHDPIYPEFDARLDGYGGPLHCPGCGSDELRSDAVEVFTRDVDASEGLHVVVYRDSVTTDAQMTGTPSDCGRGVRLSLWCNECLTPLSLEIAPHTDQPSPTIVFKVINLHVARRSAG